MLEYRFGVPRTHNEIDEQVSNRIARAALFVSRPSRVALFISRPSKVPFIENNISLIEFAREKVDVVRCFQVSVPEHLKVVGPKLSLKRGRCEIVIEPKLCVSQ